MKVSRSVQILLLLIAVAFLTPRTANAQGYVAAGLGVSFGSNASADGRADFTADIGYLPYEPIGVELDITYAPNFFKNPGSFTDNRLVTVMANVLISPTDRRGGRGGRFGYGRRRPGAMVRPYLSGGFGAMAERIATDVPGDALSNQHLGVNAGVGVMAVQRGGFGIRVDARYFQDLVGTGRSSGGIDFGSFHFWRASIGIVGSF
jgi:hypothetical protein